MKNNNCLHIDDISALYDNLLENNERNLAYSHLSNCKECSGLFNGFSKTSATIRKAFEISDKAIDISLVEKLNCHQDICSAINYDLSAFIDNELTQAAHEGIKSHLKTCKNCLSQFNQIRNLNQSIHNAFKLPTNLEINLLATLKDKLNNDCKQLGSDFSPYIDLSLNVGRHYEITRHLMTCPNCSSQISKMMDLSNLIKEEYIPKQEIDLLPKIQEKLKLKVVSAQVKNHDKAKLLKFPQLVTASVASFVVLLIAGTSLFYFSSKTDDIQPQTAENYLLDSSFSNNNDYDQAKNSEVVLYEQP